ncbi:hypothetical protein LTR72_009960 [Exophiala xenobiotica]|nr:hypothetical protein LTR72_009960 [Exophiala xenobiotica]KAK5287627.1 hypothetical protein LTR14_008857 [Exophiala xenobiotica]KAK5475494.1 hypothetical protein LTR55_009122 [Exophiala xenobiotica]
MEQRNVVIKRVRRKQHSSCDQCRKAKRACDAAHRVEVPVLGAMKLQPSYMKPAEQPERLRSPSSKCSNCQKTGRDCTFEWLEDVLPKAANGSKKRQQQCDSIEPPQQRTTSQTSPPQLTHAPTVRSTPGFLSSNLQMQSWDFNPELYDPVIDCWVEVPEILGHEDGQVAQGESPLHDQEQCASAPEWWTDDMLAEDSISGIHVPYETGQDLGDFDFDFSQADTGLNNARSWEPESESTLFPLADSEGASASNFLYSHASPSLLPADDLASGTNRWLLAQNWLRVYHDSFENALSCWLTERNCPYTLSKISSSNRISSDGGSGVWGTQWSNRIYTRVCNLDRFMNDMPGQGLSKTENSLAGKALHAAVMAFGVQWAQAGARGNMRDLASSAASMSSVHEEMNFPSADGFGRSVQEMLWNQARQALQNAAGVQSYRVAFAYIIFSLTQRPLNSEDWAHNLSRSGINGDGAKHDIQSEQTTLPEERDTLNKWQKLQDILNADGPPIFLEAASRQLISSRWKWEQSERQQTKRAKLLRSHEHFGLEQAQARRVVPSREHRETFKLLSWLAIMFDTISAAMLQRPLVVSDEDSSIDTSDPWDISDEACTQDWSGGLDCSAESLDLDGWEPVIRDDGHHKALSRDLWGTLFLDKERPPSLQVQSQDQWLFNLEEAAAILCDAAPVKVLLFRKVGRIQKLMSRRASGEALESALEGALSVYAYWNRSYGNFISQCIANHHELPPRIQSWYIVLAGHWHLGAMLLADVVEEMDGGGLSQAFQRHVRRVADFSNDMRRKNATTVSDLCRCSLHGPSLSFPRTREFTYPVNQVALLSEPWTVVLIQSFSRAGYVFVNQLESSNDWRGGTWSANEDRRYLARRRCSYCIEGLLNLANKSDMAYLAAQFLKKCLRDA